MASFLNTVSTLGALVMAATPLMAIGAVAHAEPQPVRVQVSDLDFSRAGDVGAFQHRVASAADTLCSRGQTLASMPACRAAVREEAMDQLSAGQRQAMQTASAGQAWQVAGR